MSDLAASTTGSSNLLKGIRALVHDGVYLMQDIKASSHVHNNIGHPLGTFL